MFKLQRTSNKYLSDEGKIRGIIHFHSNFSYDGYDSITDIVKFLKKRGYSFACLTEHDDDFDCEKMEQYVNTCKAVSDNTFQMIPGLECRCKNRVHILAIGIKEYFSTADPVDAVRKIQKQGGLAIIAHPLKYMNNITDDLLRVVDGIEIWNGQKDSRYIPHYKMLVYYKKIKRKFPHIKIICGPDVHSLKNYYEMDMIIQNYSGDLKSIWEKPNPALQGRYLTLTVTEKGDFICVVLLFFLRCIFVMVKFFRNIIKPV